MPTVPDARLLVTGRLAVPIEPLVERLGLRGTCELVGRYSQREAPEIFRRAHVLLHTKVNDPCPSLVIEAMASGLPVVYAASGGTVELVGDEAGIGVATRIPGSATSPRLAEALAVRSLACSPTASATRPRRGAAQSSEFALGPWLDRHAELFARLLQAGAARSRRLVRGGWRGGSGRGIESPT